MQSIVPRQQKKFFERPLSQNFMYYSYILQTQTKIYKVYYATRIATELLALCYLFWTSPPYHNDVTTAMKRLLAHGKSSHATGQPLHNKYAKTCG